jgi:hypothetical protein
VKAYKAGGKFISAASVVVSVMIVSLTFLGPRTAVWMEHETGLEIVVVCSLADPYHPLAEKIARADGLEIAEDFLMAIKLDPKFIILVASPENLSAELLLNIGRALQSSGTYPALGIITGSTMEKAEQLWARGVIMWAAISR